MAAQSALSLTEDSVRRDKDGQATLISICARIGDAPETKLDVEVDANDPLESLISDALERDVNAPYLRSARYKRAVEAIRERGRRLAAALTELRAGAESPLFPRGIPDVINLVGSSSLFDQVWEALVLNEDGVPFSIAKPVVRVVAGAAPYEAAHRSDGLKVEIISARQHWSRDIPPRQITRPLRDLHNRGEQIGIGVVAPAFPNEVEACILPLRGVDDLLAGAPVVHIDAHGILLSYEQLMKQYGKVRAAFVQDSWGLEIAPYSGLKGFIQINGAFSEGSFGPFPISGEELGGLCRQAGTPVVVMNACQAASDAAEGGIAVDLIEAGVPDVIAFRHEVTAGSAAVFVSALYGALARGVSVAQACCAARAALYRSGIETVPDDKLPFPDWISLVHYSSRPVERIPSTLPHIDLDLEFSHPELPEPLEWAMLKVQNLIYRMRLSEFAPADAGLPSRKPIVIFGPIGAGAESLLMETAAWLAYTDLRISGATLFDVGHGLHAALKLYIKNADENWTDQQIAEAIVACWGPSQAIGFFNLDLALDWGKIDRNEYLRIMRIAATLSRCTELCLVHVSRDLFERRFTGFLGINTLVFECPPISCTEIKDWLLSDASMGTDPKDTMVTYLLAWVSGGHTDLAAVVRNCASAEEREILLDHLVMGTRLDPPPHELWILRQQVQARLGVIRRELDPSKLIPLVAGLGSGITTGELAKVGSPVRGMEFPLIPRATFEEVSPIMQELIFNNLLCEYSGTVPPGWSRDDSSRYAVLRLNPLLRSLARVGLHRDVLDQLDDWTVAWATDKMHYFSHEWLDRAKRAQTEVFIEYAWPLFAIAIWIAHRGVRHSTALLTAIQRPWVVGWWPRDFELSALFDDLETEQPERAETEFDRLWKRAVSLQQQGDFEEARDLLLLAIQSVGGEAGGYPYFAAHYRLGTLCLDLNELDAATEHLAIAEGGANDFVAPNTLAHIYYEQGVLARKKGLHDRAQEKFKSSIIEARNLGLHHLTSLCFQELTDFELRLVPLILGNSAGADLDRASSDHLLQAEFYLREARDAVSRMNKPTPDEGTLTLLQARVLAARSQLPEARVAANRALAIYRQSNDHRANAVASFLMLLDTGTVSASILPRLEGADW